MSEPTPSDFLRSDPERASGVAAALLAAGRGDELVRVLLRELTGEGTWEREQALERICALRGYDALLPPLRDALADDDDAERRNAARSMLASLAAPTAAEPELALRWLRGLLAAAEPADVRILAASALGESCNPAARGSLESALDDPDPNVVSAVVDALGMLGDPRAVTALLRHAAEGEFWTRVAAIVSLGRLGDRAAVPTLTAALREPWLSGAAATALGEIGDPAALPALGEVVQRGESGAEEALHSAATLLASGTATEVPDWLRAALRGREADLSRRFAEDPDSDAGRLLGLAGTREAATLLVNALHHEARRDAAAAGLLLLPPAVAAEVLVERLDADEDGARVPLLSALPPLTDPIHIRAVARHLGDPDPEIRAAAAEALGRADEEKVLAVLGEALADPAAQHGVALTYARLGTARCDPLVRLLREGDAGVRAAAAEGLAHCGEAYLDDLSRAIGAETDAETRSALVLALGVSRSADAVRELVPLLQDPDAGMRFSAVQALGRSGREEAFAPLVSALADERSEVRAAALAGLGQLGDPRAGEPLSRHLSDADRDLRRTAIFALDRLDQPLVGERLIEALDDPDREVRLTAVRVLHRLRWEPGHAALQRVADHDPEPLVRQAAGLALSGSRGPEGREQG